MWGRSWILMEQAGNDGGAGAAAGGVAGASASGSGGQAGAGAAAGASAQGAAAQPSSALAAGAGAATPAGGDTPNALFVPDKYLVKNEDGTLNEEASRKAFLEGHGALVKRIGTGDLPPKDADGYEVKTLPDGAPTFDEIKADPDMQGFLKGAHARGITNAQLEYVLGEYFTRAPQLVNGAAALDAGAATAKLREVWKDEAALNANLGHAYRVSQMAAQKSGIPLEEIHASLGNNPTFVRLMAALGPEFQESLGAPGGGSTASVQTIQSLLASEAYKDPKHPDHARVTNQVNAWYDQNPGKSAVPHPSA